jgi:hypothetical protein
MLLALDKRTGAQRWRVDRGKGVSYSTPIMFDTLDAMLSTRAPASGVPGGHRRVALARARDSRFQSRCRHDRWRDLRRAAGGRTGHPTGRIGRRHKARALEVPPAPRRISLVHYRGLIYLRASRVWSLAGRDERRAGVAERVGGIFSASPSRVTARSIS